MFNQYWDSHVKNCWKVWNEEKFSYLKKLPAYHAFLHILGTAKSIRDLERLHNMLPSNVRLLRDDWIDFKNFWKKYFKGKSVERCRQQLVEWLLFEQSISWVDIRISNPELDAKDLQGGAFKASSTSAQYYIDRIRSNCIVKPPKHFAGGEDGKGAFTPKIKILGCSEHVRDRSLFRVHLFDSVVGTELFLSQDKQHILVRFIFKEIDLTEILAFSISELSDYYIWKCGVTGYTRSEGEYLYISFEFQAGELVDMLDSLDEENMLANKDFLSSMADLLREHEIPVKGDLISTEVKPSSSKKEGV